MEICGVEEAGRGPVIGPMVMAGVVIDPKDEQKLRELGVKDSKLILPPKRRFLFDEIIAIAKRYKIIILEPAEIDSALLDEEMNLNWLEAKTSAEIINDLRPQKAILDCPSPNIPAYRDYVKERVKDRSIEIIAEHKADLNHTVVGAASILAKVTRDAEIEKIKEKAGVDFGSGYPSDPKTVEFLKENHSKYDFFRKTWASYKRHSQQKKQSTLDRF